MTDIQKFQCMVRKYRDAYKHYEVFADKIGASRASVNNWENGKGNKLQTKTRIKICDGFRLKYEVWEENYYREEEFIKQLDTYFLVVSPYSKWEKNTFGENIIHLTDDEKNSIKKFSEQTYIYIPDNIAQYSPDFMLALTELLKDKGQILEALKVLEILFSSDTLYKAKHYNEIQHLKAILLSSDKIGDWNGAIEILNLLYFSAKYHLENPEILTLLASNYKRKALYDEDGSLYPLDSPDINMDLLGRALVSYQESYNLKEQDKYYDAINIAYLKGILSALEEDKEELDFRTDIKALHQELRNNGWKNNSDNWWEISIEIEFLVLEGNVSDAKAKLNEYLDFNINLNRFDIETTIRQIELYVHFTDDKKAKIFLNEIQESWKGINGIHN